LGSEQTGTKCGPWAVDAYRTMRRLGKTSGVDENGLATSLPEMKIAGIQHNSPEPKSE